MRIALAALMALHGIAHLVGFAGSWQLAASGSIPYKTTVLAGHVDLGNVGIRALGLLWALVALAFLTTAGGAVLDTDWWMKAALGVTIASLALTALELPQARIGLVVNIGLVTTLLLTWRYHWA
jgi:hypothetical protein